MFKIVQKRNWLFLLSILVLVPGLVALGRYGLKLGVDFTGGTRLTVQYSDSRPTVNEVKKTIDALGLGSVTAQTAGDRDMIIRLPTITNEQRQQIIDALTTSYGPVTEQNFDSIGPVVGQELLRKAYAAIALVLIAIVIYISLAFRRVNVGPVPAWIYGVSAIIALIHDVLIVIGIFAILGHYRGVEIDSLFVTALLTVLGFSVHDTIVVFDRVRDRLIVGGGHTYEETVTISLNQTMVRSLNTSLTTLLVLLALWMWGGESIKNFVLALIIGIISGTYSSIFVASPLLVVYERWRANRGK